MILPILIRLGMELIIGRAMKACPQSRGFKLSRLKKEYLRCGELQGIRTVEK